MITELAVPRCAAPIWSVWSAGARLPLSRLRRSASVNSGSPAAALHNSRTAAAFASLHTPPRYTEVFVNILLLATYELGRQPFGLASPAAWLRKGGHFVRCFDLSRQSLDESALREAQ